jgi:hypothetical protein
VRADCGAAEGDDAVAKVKPAVGDAQEKKLRRQLQQAEEAYIEAQQEVEAAQTRLAKATSRLAKRAAEVQTARERVTAHAAATASLPPAAVPMLDAPPLPTTADLVVPGADGGDTASPARPARARRPRRQAAPEAPASTNGDVDEPLGIVVP